MDPEKVYEHMLLKDKAKKEVIYKKYVQFYNLQFKLNQLGQDPLGEEYSLLADRIQKLQMLLASSKKKDKSEWVWMTVNIHSEACYEYCEPSSVVEPLDDDETIQIPNALINSMNQCLVKKAEKFCERKMFRSYCFVIEQRESKFEPSKLYCGQHFHFLFRRNLSYDFSQIKRNSKNTWRDLCNVESDAFHIRRCPEEFVQDKIDYCLGKKTAEGKDTKVEVDREFREFNELKSMYYSPDIYKDFLV